MQGNERGVCKLSEFNPSGRVEIMTIAVVLLIVSMGTFVAAPQLLYQITKVIQPPPSLHSN